MQEDFLAKRLAQAGIAQEKRETCRADTGNINLYMHSFIFGENKITTKKG